MTWVDAVWKIIVAHWQVGQTFTLQQIYEFQNELAVQYPDNLHAEDKIREILQQLRDDNHIEFVDNEGTYRRLQ